jgi:hypothetical protein
MRLGKCIKEDLGFLGCKADATQVLATNCNAKELCELSVVDKKLKDLSTCRDGLELFLEVTFACLTGE